MGALRDFQDMTEFYPGSKKPILRHPNRPTSEHRSVEGRWDAKPKMYKVGGVETEFFTIGDLAKALGRKPVTIRKWEREGVIPKPTYRRPSEDPRGERRLYTRAQVEGVQKIAEEESVLFSDKPIKSTAFTRRVIDLFKELADQ